MYIAFNRHRVK